MGIKCKIIRNPETNEIENVEAPNGAQSILFQEALAYTQNKEEALDLWATSYIDEFKEIYGNSEVSKNFSSPLQVGTTKVFYKDRVNPITDESTGEIELDLIESEVRGQGNARRTMQEFLNFTDSQRKDVFLTASPRDKQTSFKRLVEFYESFGFKMEPTGFEMMRAAKRTQTSKFLDKNGEAKLEYVLDFVRESENQQKEAEPLTNQEKITVSNILRSKQVTSSELSSELNNIFRDGTLNTQELDKSTLFSQPEKQQIKNNEDYQNNLAELSKKEITVEDTVAYDPMFIVLDGTINKYGLYNTKNPLSVEADIKSQVGGLSTIEEFETAFNQLDYPGIVEEFNSNPDFAYKMFSRFSQMSRMEVLDSNMESKNQPNKSLEVENSMDISKMNTSAVAMLLETSPRVWEESQQEVEEALEQIEKDAREAGIDLENFSNMYSVKTQEEIFEFLENTLSLKSNTTEESLSTFLESYRDLYNIEVEVAQEIEEVPLQHRNKALVKLDDYSLGEYNLFDQNSLLKIKQGVYQKVEKVSTENLYEMIYEQAVNSDNRILPTVAYFNSAEVDNQQLQNPARKDEVINNMQSFIFSQISKMDLGTDVYDADVAEQLLLFKYYFDAPIQTEKRSVEDKEFTLLEEFNGEEFDLVSTFPTEFQQKKLEEREKNSENYINFYSKFTIGNEGIKLIEDNQINREEVKLSIPENIAKDFKNYAIVSREDSMRNLVEVEDKPRFISLENKKNYYQNNVLALEPFKGDYKNIDTNSITTIETSEDFIRVGDRLFQKVQESGNLSLYRQIPTNSGAFRQFSQFDILNKFAQEDIKPYIRNQEQTEQTSNLYTQKELEEINQKHFNCN